MHKKGAECTVLDARATSDVLSFTKPSKPGHSAALRRAVPAANLCVHAQHTREGAGHELVRLGVPYWQIEGLTSPDSLQVFLNDPCGNMVELHQIDKCNYRASDCPKA
jgi:hypothetical protein